MIFEPLARNGSRTCLARQALGCCVASFYGFDPGWCGCVVVVVGLQVLADDVFDEYCFGALVATAALCSQE